MKNRRKKKLREKSDLEKRLEKRVNRQRKKMCIWRRVSKKGGGVRILVLLEWEAWSFNVLCGSHLG